jgi:Uma2 family endonuclease
MLFPADTEGGESVKAQARRLFTVEEYHLMAKSGIIGEDDRVELLEGEVFRMSPIGSRHAACVNRLNTLFSRAVGERAIVCVQNPLRLGEYSEPQPDVVLARPRPDFYALAHPGPEDVLLLVEVMESSQDYDREVKLPLYARHGVSEVWLVDLEGQAVEVYRRPSAGGYREVRRVTPGSDPLSVEALPGVSLSPEEILG